MNSEIYITYKDEVRNKIRIEHRFRHRRRANHNCTENLPFRMKYPLHTHVIGRVRPNNPTITRPIRKLIR